MTQAELAAESGLTQGAISKLENAQSEPTPQTVDALARALGYLPKFFFSTVRERSLPQTFYRKRKSLGAGQLREINARVAIVREQMRSLLRAAEVPEFRLPKLNVEQFGSATRVASELRRALKIPRGPIENVVSMLENAGILVIGVDFRTHQIDALSIYDQDDTLPPLIFVNTAMPGERTRFSMVHELAHIVLHHHQVFPAEDCEQDADAFAAEFLMPAEDIRPHLRGHLTPHALIAMKPHWKVSAAAMLQRACHLGQLPERRQRSLWMQMGKLGYRKDEPCAIDFEQPTLVGELLRAHLDGLGYSAKDLAATMLIHERELLQMYPELAPKGLRVIKS